MMGATGPMSIMKDYTSARDKIAALQDELADFMDEVLALPSLAIASRSACMSVVSPLEAAMLAMDNLLDEMTTIGE